MDLEIGVLSREQGYKLNKLLSTASTYEISNLDELLLNEIKYFIQSKEHLLKIYGFRLDNTKKSGLKKDLAWLLGNMNAFEGNKIRVSFIGSKNEHIMIFSDIDIVSLLGVVSKDSSMTVKRM